MRLGRAAAAFALAALLVSAAFAAPRSTGNLVQNSGAEAGPGATGDQIVPIPGWTTTGSFTAAVYGTSGLPPAPPGGGKNLFAGGPGAEVSTATQLIDVSSSAADIDAGRLQAALSAYLGGWESQSDFAIVRASFLNAASLALATLAVGPVTVADRRGETVLLPRSRTAAVPAGTRSVRITITARRSSGVYNDGYADNVSLLLGRSLPRPTAYRWSLAGKSTRPGATISAVGRGGFTLDARGKLTKASGAVVIAFDGLSGEDGVWHLRASRPGSYRSYANEGKSLLTLAVEVVSATGAAKVPCAADPSGTLALHLERRGKPVLELRRLCERRYLAIDGERRGDTLRASIVRTG